MYEKYLTINNEKIKIKTKIKMCYHIPIKMITIEMITSPPKTHTFQGHEKSYTF